MFFLWILHFLPLPVLGRIGEFCGFLLFYLLKTRRNITLLNLSLCFPQFSNAKIKLIAKSHFKAYARSVIERGVLWWAPKKRLIKLINIESEIPLETSDKKPTVFLCPHFVCLETAGVIMTMTKEICSIYSEQSNKVFDDALKKGRLRFTKNKNNLVKRNKGIKPIIKAMRKGTPFLMFPDMDFGKKESIFVPFFGVLAATLTAPARITLMTKGQVIPIFTSFMPNYKGWKVKFYPPWKDYPGKNLEAATKRMNNFIEERVLEAPEEYFWSHKRFKTRPDGCTNIYEQLK